MTDPLALPGTSFAASCLTLIRGSEDRLIVDHSIRSFLFARLIAEQDQSVSDADYDEEALYAACILHDLGLGDRAPGQARFEVEGADLAGEFLRSTGVDSAVADRVWEAIALHSSLGLADRFGLLTSLTHRGVFTDGGRIDELSTEDVEAVRVAYPRPQDDRSIRDAIVTHAGRSAAAAPPFSIAAEFLREDRERQLTPEA